MKTKLIILIPLVFSVACATTDRAPIVDMQGVNFTQYQDDLADCERYTDKVDGGQEILMRTVFGVVAGAAIGVAIGDSDFIATTAGIGATTGAMKGTENVIEERNHVLHNCLRGRGYMVLNRSL